MQAEWHHVSEVAETTMILGLLCVELELMQYGLEELLVKALFGSFL